MTKICNTVVNVNGKQFILLTHFVVFMSTIFTKAIDLIITVQKRYKIQELKKYIYYIYPTIITYMEVMIALGWSVKINKKLILK